MQFFKLHNSAIRSFLFILSLFIVIMASVINIYIAIYNPSGYFLVNEKDGKWIRSRQSIWLGINKNTESNKEIYRTGFIVETFPKEVYLYFKAFRAATIFIDNVCIYKNNRPIRDWNRTMAINLAPYIKPGQHKIIFEVINIAGPSAIIASCKPLGIKTSEQWKVSRDGNTWNNACLADKIIPPDIYYNFKSTDKALISIMPILLVIFIISFLLGKTYNSKLIPVGFKRSISVAVLTKWCVLGSYIILSINNFHKLPITMGMDIKGHLEYIQYIVNNWRIPLVTDGWSMGEPPLFYISSAFIYALFIKIFSLRTVYRIVKILPILCGAFQIEICYRALKTVYPTREDLQAFGTIIGGFIPVNIFASQFIGTEPIAACFLSLVILYAFKLIHSNTEPKAGFFLSLGIFLGLSVLSKITALILIPPLLLIIFVTFFKRYSLTKECIFLTTKYSAIVLVTVLALSGWFFIRNYYEFGNFIFTNTSYWGNSIGSFQWWQDPGYRTLNQLMFSSQALFHPIYSGLFSFWDSLYSSFWTDGWVSGRILYRQCPPWNYDFMLSSIWLSLFPCVAILFGMMNIFKVSTDERRDSIFFSTLCVFILFAALIYQFLLAPVYTAVKGQYLLGILPCFAVLSASGIDLINNKIKIFKLFVLGILICWVISVYVGYFVWNVSDDLKISDHLIMIIDLIDQNRFTEADEEFNELQIIDSKKFIGRPELIKPLNEIMYKYVNMGDDTVALRYLMKLKDIQPDNPSHCYNIACIYSKRNMQTESIEWLRRAIDKGFNKWELIKKEPYLENIRNTAYIKDLIKNH